MDVNFAKPNRFLNFEHTRAAQAAALTALPARRIGWFGERPVEHVPAPRKHRT